MTTNVFPVDSRKVNALLTISAAEARRLTPATISVSWPGFTADDVRRYLAAAFRLSHTVNRRLGELNTSSHPEVVWDAFGSPELTWFGSFSDRKLQKVCRTFLGIERHLTSPGLKVICTNAKGYSGFTIPFIETIRLGTWWQSPGQGVNDDSYRILTLVHEASHVCGRFSFEHYGFELAHGLAQWPMRATRNADNYAFYAMHVLDRERVA